MGHVKHGQSGVGQKTGKNSDANLFRAYGDESKKRLWMLSGGRSPEAEIINTRAAWGINPKSGERQLMRLTKGGTTVWVSEQKKKDEESYIVDECVFEKGRLQTDKGTNIDSFMMYNVNNVKNGGGLYYEYNPQKEVGDYIDAEDLILEVKGKIAQYAKNKNKHTELRRVAMGLHLGVNENTPIIKVKEVMYKATDANASAVAQAFEDKVVKAMAYIQIAEEKQQITYTGSEVKWTGQEGGTILHIPQGREWRKYLAGYLTEYENTELFKEFDAVASKK